MTNESDDSNPLIHVHVCATCGRVSRREEPDGTPDGAGVFYCSFCGHAGPLNEDFVQINDEKLKR